MRREQRCQRIGSGLGTGQRARLVTAAKGIRRWRKQHIQQQRRVHAAIQRQVAHRQRPQGFAVVAAAQGHKAGAARDALVMKPVVGHFQRHFHPGRPIVGIKHLGQGRTPGLLRGTRKQAFGQLHCGRVRTAGQNDLLQRVGLLANGACDAGFGMAVDIGPPTADRIQYAAAIVPHQPRAFATRYREQRQRIGVFAHLCAGVPEHGQVTRTPSVIGGYHGGIVKSFHPAIIAAGTVA